MGVDATLARFAGLLSSSGCLMIFSYQQQGLDVVDGLPHIVTLWASLPLD